MPRTPEQLQEYCSTLEKRCEHLESIIDSAISRLRSAATSMEPASPTQLNLTWPIVKWLRDVAGQLETGLRTAPGPSRRYPEL